MSLEKNGKTKYFYTAYGLNIRSDFQLPELVPSKSGENISIRLGKLSNSFLKKELQDAVISVKQGITVQANNKAFSLHWRGIGTALIRNGNDVIIDPETGIRETDLSPYVNGSILAILMHQRGLLVLHASAVVTHGKGVAFLGDKGAGKSTIAAYLQNKGYDLLTDDLVPIRFVGEDAETIPGFPRIRLWKDSVKSVGLNLETLSQINRFIDKYSYQCLNNFTDNPVRLSRIYVLTEDPEIGIERLNFQEAFMEITRHSYLARYIQATGQTVNHFSQCARMVKSVPIFRLKRPHDFNLLSEVSSIVEKNIY